MQTHFKTNAPLGASYNVNLDDSLNLKRVLIALGYYRVPEYGLTEYPDDAAYSALKAFQRDRGLHPDGVVKPMQETAVALGEEVMYAGGPDGTDGLVHVDAYTQDRDGTQTHVTSHTRAAPGRGVIGKGSVDSVPSYSAPVDAPEVRGLDGYGRGEFGAPRDYGPHKGVDIVVTPEEMIYSPVDGEFVRKAPPYTGDNRYSGVLIRSEDGAEVKIFYINPSPTLKKGDKVVSGTTPIGEAQDVRPKYPETPKRSVITPHIHIQVLKNGEYINSMP